MRYLLILFSFIWILHGEYSLKIYLRRLDVGQGFLKAGNHCADTWNLGDQCNIQLKLGVCLGPLDAKDPCPNPTPIDLGNVTFNSNAVDFSGAGTAYGAWTNPNVFPNIEQDAIYAGFALNVEIREARRGLLIDSYQQIFDDGSTPNNFLYFSHERPLLDPTMLSVAWKAVGHLPTPAPPPTTTEAPTPTHTTVTEPSTEPPTTPEPVTATDCHEVKGSQKEDGLYQILINDTLVDVYCSFGTNVALTHIQGRGESDNTSFAVDFPAYRSPIGSPDKGNNFWLGLDNMNLLTSNNGQSYSLMIEVCCGNQSTKQYYTNVTIGNSASGYVINGNATLGVGLNNDDQGDGYGKDLGSKFVTYKSWAEDKTENNEYCLILKNEDSDKNYSNGTGGWWFGNCRENLNGQYYTPSDLDTACKIQPVSGKWPKGSGIELVTKNVASPAIDGVSYTKARMALYRGTATPLGLKDFCS